MLLTVGGARIHYERAGEGFPLLFLHAGCADARMWDPQVDAFARHFDVVRPDARGFGNSTMPEGDWSPTEDLLALMNAFHQKPAHVVGCSMGAATAIDFALEHGEWISKLVLVGPGLGGRTDKYPEVFAEEMAARKSGDMEALNQALMRLLLDGPRRRPGYVRQPLRDLFLDMNSRAIRVDFKKSPALRPNPPALERLDEIHASTLIVVGDEDVPHVLDSVELLMEKVPHARKAVIHDAAHLPNLEHPDEFNRIVLEFLLAG